MASSALPEPGTEYGPCTDRCKHKDCAMTREQSECICRICEEPIGYGRHFYREQDWQHLVHAVCLEIEVERT